MHFSQWAMFKIEVKWMYSNKVAQWRRGEHCSLAPPGSRVSVLPQVLEFGVLGGFQRVCWLPATVQRHVDYTIGVSKLPTVHECACLPCVHWHLVQGVTCLMWHVHWDRLQATQYRINGIKNEQMNGCNKQLTYLLEKLWPICVLKVAFEPRG